MKRDNGRRIRHAGFTLVEMLVVLAILVLVASLVVPRILGSQRKADIRVTQTRIGLLRGALESYAADCKTYPTTEEGLEALLSRPPDLPESIAWGPTPYVDAIPKDPWGNDLQYEYPPTRGTGDTPDIWSFGPDGEDGTEDDICSWTKEPGSGGTEESVLLGEETAGTRRPARASKPREPRELPTVSSEPSRTRTPPRTAPRRTTIPLKTPEPEIP